MHVRRLLGRRPPSVSLILCVKNGLPHLADAVDSALAQSYSDFELVVQDGGSTDGSLEYLRRLRDRRVRLVSAPDTGIGQAANRAMSRCRGEIIGSIDADNLLEPDAVERAVAILGENDGCAAVYGAVRIVREDGTTVETFVPAPFDLVCLLSCEVVPPFSTSFFSRRVCGRELRFDESLETCADFDVWLRISHLPILRSEDPLGSTRLSDKSMTMNARRYDQFVADKSRALERYLGRYPGSPLVTAVRRRSLAGIYMWAAESVYALEGASPRALRYLDAAAEVTPDAERVQRFREMLAAAQTAEVTEPLDPPDSQPMRPLTSRSPVGEGERLRDGGHAEDSVGKDDFQDGVQTWVNPRL